MKKRIIVCGYPKSGNTWLTRLTAEILKCPVVGFWCEPFNNEEAIERLDCDSEFQCFKGHHSLEQLQHTLSLYGSGTEKVIYIYRDPRDVVVSASRYFKASPKYKTLYHLIRAARLGSRKYHQLIQPYSFVLDIFVKGLIEGTDEGAWLQTPWKAHVESFINDGRFLCLSYEDLKSNPMTSASAICTYCEISRSEASLADAVHAQSFHVRKRQFEDEGNASKAAFLHTGESGGWRSVLSQDHVAYIESHLGELMTRLGYPTQSQTGSMHSDDNEP